jgi:hypothetical protein
MLPLISIFLSAALPGTTTRREVQSLSPIDALTKIKDKKKLPHRLHSESLSSCAPHELQVLPVPVSKYHRVDLNFYCEIRAAKFFKSLPLSGER